MLHSMCRYSIAFQYAYITRQLLCQLINEWFHLGGQYWENIRIYSSLLTLIYREDVSEITLSRANRILFFSLFSPFSFSFFSLFWLHQHVPKASELSIQPSLLDEIQHECRGLFSLDAADSFDLQACATRASGEGMLQPWSQLPQIFTRDRNLHERDTW